MKLQTRTLTTLKDRRRPHSTSSMLKPPTIDGKVLTFKAKAGQGGKLFGSVTGKDISALIKRDFGFDVDKRKIVTKSDIKSFGTFTAEARLFTGIVAQFSVKVEEE